MSTLGFIILASLLVSAISFVGAFVFLPKRIDTTQLTSSLVSFAAGIMLAAALLDLLPEALTEGNSQITVPILGGIVLFFIFERFLLWFHHHHEPHGIKPTSLLVLVGDGIHNFIDGIAIAASFLTNPALGMTTTLAIAAHEIPQEISDLSILLYGGMKKKTALVFNFISALIAVFGAIVGYYYLQHLEESIPVFLAFTVGMFLYIACSDLIPDMHKDFAKQRRWEQTIPFIVGIAIMWILTTLLHE